MTEITTEMLMQYSRIIAGERVAMCALIIALLGMVIYRENRRSSMWLSATLIIDIVQLMADSEIYTYDIKHNIPAFLVIAFHYISYSFGCLTLLGYILYAVSYIEERSSVSKWAYVVPTVLESFNFFINIFNVASGKTYKVENGIVIATDYSPLLSDIITGIVIVYILIAALTQLKIIGWKSVLILGIFGLGPVAAMVLSPEYVLIVATVALLITYILLQSDNSERNKRESSVIEALSAGYLNVYIIDAQRGQLEIVKLDGYITTLLRKEKKKLYPYESICRSYIEGRVYSEDQKMVTECMKLQNIVSNLNDCGEYEFTYRVLDEGQIGYYLGRYVAVGNGYIVCGFKNIDSILAEEKARNEELENARDAAEAADRAKTTFLFNMSHDIRTPMNAIIGYTNLMKKNIEDTEKVGDYLDKITNASSFLLDLINNVLDMARIENGKLTLDEEAWSVDAFNDSVYSVFAEDMKKKNIDFKQDTHVEHNYLMCDIVKMKKVQLNLLSNALKYTPVGGSIHMTVSELASDRAGYALIQTVISDTGIGMSEEFMSHMFEQFSRERTTTENKVQGTGLGLAIVKSLVELMGGHIDVNSTLGKGTTITITIYHKIVSREDIKKTELTDAHTANLSGKRILLAEDNDFNAEIAIEILKGTGADIDRAEDGVTCVKMLEDAEADYYDLILMDVQMPNMDGYKATETIRHISNRAKAGIPIIAMTANAFEEDKNNALKVGMNGHLSKPIEIPKLMMTLSEVMANKAVIATSATEGQDIFDPYETSIYLQMKQSLAASMAPGGFFAYRAEEPERLVYANELACRIWGCRDYRELYEYVGGTFKGMLHPEDYERATREIWEQIKKDDNELGLDRVKYRIIKKDGSIGYIEDYGKLVKDAQRGDIFYVFVSEAE